MTGASRGIGRATAIAAAARGWRVGINYAGNQGAAEDTLSAVEAAGGKGFVACADISREDEVLALFDQVASALGPIDALVNNAGIVAPVKTLAEMDVARMRRLFEVNILGSFLCAREAARRLPDGGAIVNVSSIAAKLGSPNEFIDYAASKGAIDSMTVGLAKELAPRAIRVNGVRPGLIDTDIHGSAGVPDRVARMERTVPLGRAGRADEVANAILWLLDGEQSSYITGVLLDVGGGR